MADREISVVGKLFVKKGVDGDFAWMVQEPTYNDTLFVIAENFLDSLRDDATNGGGTAVLRHFSPQRIADGEFTRAVGVPTGWSTTAMGFPHMDVDVKRAIDLSLDRIALVLDQNPGFTRLMYSCDEQHQELIGVKIFDTTLSFTVQGYISRALHGIGERQVKHSVLGTIRKQELKLLRHALLVTEYNASQSSLNTQEVKKTRGEKRPWTAAAFQA